MNTLDKFWNWYEKNLKINTLVASGLFILQIIHLYWLTTHIVTNKLFNIDLFPISGILELGIILVDYTEIPALITTSLVYLNEHRKKFAIKNILYLFFLNIQWVHLFWLTDEVVIEQFSGNAPIILPFWLSWLAIIIDYLELPVIYDTIKKSFKLFIVKK